jgi:hypothetical protein
MFMTPPCDCECWFSSVVVCEFQVHFVQLTQWDYLVMNKCAIQMVFLTVLCVHCFYDHCVLQPREQQVVRG